MTRDMRAFDLNLLLIFEALLKTENVTHAGALVRLSQPATSYGLSKLRTAFNDPLFVRTPKGMRPTPHALRLAEPIQRALSIVRDEVLQEPAFDLGSTKRRFTLAMTDVAEMVFLPRILRLFEEQAPRANIKTVIMPSKELEGALETGAVDLAIGLFPDLKRAPFFQQRLFQHPFVCIVRSDHPSINRKMTLSQFLSASHAVVEAQGRSEEIFERLLERSGLTRRVMLRIPHFLSIPMVIAASDLVVTIPHVLAEVFARSTNIRLVPPPIKVGNYDVRQYWHERSRKDPANRWLRTAIAERFKTGPDL